MSGGYARDLLFTLTNGTSWGAKGRHLKAYAGWCRAAIAAHRRYHRELHSELTSLGLGRSSRRRGAPHRPRGGRLPDQRVRRRLGGALDWYGGGLSGSVSRCTPEGVERLHDFRYPHSLGLFYAQVTQALGFRSSRHEGKILGLAAYGDPRVLGPGVREASSAAKETSATSGMDPAYARELAERHPRSTWRRRTRTFSKRCRARSRATGLRRRACRTWSSPVVSRQRKAEPAHRRVGGSAARLHLPNMGDGGTDVGAVLAFLCARGEVKSRESESCYLGPDFSEERMPEAIRAAGLQPSRSRTLRETSPSCSPTETSWPASRARWSTVRGRSETARSCSRHGLRCQRVAQSPPRPHGVHAVRAGDGLRTPRDRYVDIERCSPRRAS